MSESMEGSNAETVPSYEGGQISQPPPIDNIHQSLDNGGGTPYQPTPPAQANLQTLPPYTSTPPPAGAEISASLSNGASPMATTSHAATPPNTTTIPIAPKDGKSAAQPDFPTPLPSQAQAHGAPVRQYLNENVAPYFLEVSKYLVAHRPERPLEFIAEYFAEKSRQVEGTGK